MPVDSPLVSVIIPCYNQGAFLDEAIRSVLAQTYSSYEIIVVNDGSTDPSTLALLADCEWPRTRIIHSHNQGLSEARNLAVRHCSGQYVLPLDADDKIGPAYLEKAVPLLQADDGLGIVTCEVELFGDRSGPWPLAEVKLPELLVKNSIVCSSLFRRVDWEAVGGYSPVMKFGWEDYDFWLSLIGLGRSVARIPQTLFYYRRRAGSMIELMGREQRIYSYEQLFRRHSPLYADQIGLLLEEACCWLELRQQLQYTQAECDRLRADKEAFLGSLSWRLTAPFRWLVDLFTPRPRS